MGHVTTFAQQKGGAGKTTLLAHVADASRRAGHSVALIDLDPQGSLTRWAKMADADGFTLIETASYRAGSDIRGAKDSYDRVYVDCPGSASSLLEAALRESDLVVVPCQSGVMDVWATEAVLEMCKGENTPASVVLNRIPPRGAAADDAAAALAGAGAHVMQTRIGNRIAFSKGFAAGATALAMPGQKVAKGEIAALVDEIEAALSS